MDLTVMGALPDRLTEVWRRALAGGVLEPIETRQQWTDDRGIRFLIKIISSRSKPEGGWSGEEGSNPFLPPRPELLLGDLPPAHRAVLNRFPVIEYHLLLVTREFVHQQTLLDQGDFRALGETLRQIDGLGFYNGGPRAGASQPHKHLQLVPRITPEQAEPPIAALVEPLVTKVGQPFTLARLPFAHSLARLEPQGFSEPAAEAAELERIYWRLLAAIDLDPGGHPGSAAFPHAYNLLVSRRWMMAVPRVQECYRGISVNALGFAGCLLARNEAEAEMLRQAGPAAVLERVAGANEQA